MPKNTFYTFLTLFVFGVVLCFTTDGGFLRGFGFSAVFFSPLMLLFLWLEARNNKKED
jgi:hypothetical protein